MITLIARIIRTILLLLTLSSLSGCLILMVTGPSEFEKKSIDYQKRTESNQRKLNYLPRSYTMRGLLDIFSTGMNTLADKIHSQLGMETTTLSYLEERRLSSYLIKEYQSNRFKGPIILIGHSYGADDQLSVARQLNKAHIPVDLVIALDNTKRQTIPSNVKVYYNIYSGKSSFWGNVLIPENPHTKVVNIDLIKEKGIKRVGHLNIDKLPEVQNYVLEVIKKEVIQDNTVSR